MDNFDLSNQSAVLPAVDHLPQVEDENKTFATPKEIFAPQNRRGGNVKENLYRYLYAFFLLHPEQREDEFGDVLFFFVSEHMMRKAMAKNHYSWKQYEEIAKREEERLLRWAQAHQNEVNAWGACHFWLKELLRTHKRFIEMD